MTNPICTLEPPAETAIEWIHPRGWKVDNRTRRYISLAERNYSNAGDWEVLCRSARAMAAHQDSRGSFYRDEEYLEGDRVDDQLGGSAMIAYYLARNGPDAELQQALEKSVRFHLDHLVFRSADRPFSYSRFYYDRDTAGDWCNTLWCISKGTTVLAHGVPFLEKETVKRLREVMIDNWSYISTYPCRDENPCHNQLLAYCHIGISHAETVGNKTIRPEILRYYHEHLRRLRIRDRGYDIYSEFNEWDSHYGVLSWSILEQLFVLTGDPVFADDAQQMALYFNEQTSAGGYGWGGSRNNECGVDEFPDLFSARDEELDFQRLLFPEPSHLWSRLVTGGHGGSGLVQRIETKLPKGKPTRPSTPTPWHFRNKAVSVCLRNDRTLHQVSAAGLELVPVAGTPGSGVRWRQKGAWMHDRLQVRSPMSSEALSYVKTEAMQTREFTGLTSMHRGYGWETREWWLSSGRCLWWIGQLIPHYFPVCEKIDFLIGTPLLTRVGGEPVPVAEVESAEGIRADTQEGPVTVTSRRFLRFGDVYVGATAPMEFVRPSREAFHTFPLPAGQLWRDATAANHLRVAVSDVAGRQECRESRFFAVEIGDRAPSFVVRAQSAHWALQAEELVFNARREWGIWNYSVGSEHAEEKLPDIGFGAHPLC